MNIFYAPKKSAKINTFAWFWLTFLYVTFLYTSFTADGKVIWNEGAVSCSAFDDLDFAEQKEGTGEKYQKYKIGNPICPRAHNIEEGLCFCEFVDLGEYHGEGIVDAVHQHREFQRTSLVVDIAEP